MTITSEQIAEWRRLVEAELEWATTPNIQLCDAVSALLAAYEQQAALLAEAREALEAIPEWLLVEAITPYVTCQWCHDVYAVKYPTESTDKFEHKPDCPRQAVLAKLGQP